jgi:hypothetical protein
VAAGKGRAVWAFFALPLIGSAVIIWGGFTVLASSPFLGFVLIVTGLVLLGAMAFAFHRVSVGISEGVNPDDLAWKAIEPFQSIYLILGLVVLFGGLLAIVAIIATVLLTR